MNKTTITKFLIITIAFTFALSASYIFAAWTGPTQAPPGGNTSTPIHVGGTTQTKNGAFRVGGLRSFTDIYADGKVGIGTTNPGVKLEVKSGDIKVTDGTTAVTIDEISIKTGRAAYYIQPSVTTNDLYIGHINGSSGHYRNIGFGASNSIGFWKDNKVNTTPALYVNMANSKIGIGKTNPNLKLDVNGGIVASKNVYTQTTPGGIVVGLGEYGQMLSDWKSKVGIQNIYGFGWEQSSGGIGILIPATRTFGIYGRTSSGGGGAANLYVSGNITYSGTHQGISDERLKENIEPVDGALDKVKAMNGVYFNMIDTPEKKSIGVIAQDVQKVLPEIVGVVDEENGYLGVSYTSIIPVLIEAIKELSEKNDELEKRILKLEK